MKKPSESIQVAGSAFQSYKPTGCVLPHQPDWNMPDADSHQSTLWHVRRCPHRALHRFSERCRQRYAQRDRIRDKGQCRPDGLSRPVQPCGTAADGLVRYSFVRHPAMAWPAHDKKVTGARSMTAER